MVGFVSANIFVNEFLPDSSATPDKKGEWIELFNNGSSSVDLTDWNISETSSTAGNFTINNAIIPSKGFVVLAFNFSFFNNSYPNVNASGVKIIEYGLAVPNFILTNSGDTIFLYNNSGNLVDSVTYASSTANIPIGRHPDGSSNIIDLNVQTPGDNNDNVSPVFNKWINPFANNSFIAGLVNVTVNITDAAHSVNVSLIDFNNSNFTMTKTGDLWYFVWNTSLNAETFYNITIFFNDTLGFSNIDTVLDITVDNTNPSISNPTTEANSRNFISPEAVFNATADVADTNLLNVTCGLNGVTVGNFSVEGDIHICNLTAPSTENDFEITFTAIDKAGNTNTTTINFTTKNATTATLTPQDVTVSDLNQSDKIISVNVTLKNTGSNPMYDTGVILDSFSSAKFSAISGSYQSCSLNINSSQNCTVTFNISIAGGTTGTHSIFWNRNWTNNDFTQVTFAQVILSIVTITNNPQMTTATNLTTTINHAENSTVSLDINSTGNFALNDVNITFIQDTVQSVWLNVTSFNFNTISAASNVTLDVNVAIPRHTNPGNYTGTFNITASDISHKSVLLTVEVPTDNSWLSSPNETITHRRSDASGIVGTFTINNTGNVGHNFTFYPPTGNLFTFPNLWNDSNIRNIYVERGQAATVSIFHKEMSGNAPGSIGSFNLTFTIKSENTSQTNTTFMSLVRDDDNPNVNITNPTDNSFVKGIVEFNVTATDLNLSRLEYFINDSLVFNSAEINFTFNWDTTNGSYSDEIYALKVITFDSAGNSNTSNITVTVNNTDSPPIFRANIPTINVIEDNDSTTLNLSLFFESIDGDNLKYNFTQPDNVTVHINNATQIANFTPDLNFNGINFIIFTAIDTSNQTSSSNNITIIVANVNDAPTTPNLISPESGSNVTSSAGKATLKWDNSIDAENDQITYHVFFSDNSNNITFNATTTSTSLQLTNLDSNTTYFWNVLANDSLLNSSKSATFNFTMIRDNDPVINKWTWNNTIDGSSTDTSPAVAENKTLSFTINASDPDNDPINFTWFVDNVNASNVQNFTFNLTNNFTAAGNYVIKLQVQDNNSNSAEQEWQVTVTNTNREPVLDPIGNKAATEDSTLKFNITVNDPDNNSLTFTSNFTSNTNPIAFTKDANNSLATVSWTPTNDEVGSNTITFVTKDSTKNGSETITITVTNTNDAPTITSFSPTKNKTIASSVGSQRFDITFTDVDAGDYVNATWFRNTTTKIATNSSNVTVTNLDGGIYNITVIVNDTAGAEARNEWVLIVTTEIVSDELTSPVLSLNETERQNATDVVVNQSTFGSIGYTNETLNFSGVVNLEDAINISKGFISVDTVTYPGLNGSAALIMKGLNFTKTPLIFNTSGFESTTGATVCPDTVCTNVTYDTVNGVLKFNVPHFSTYFTQINGTNGAPVVTSTPVTRAIERQKYTYDVDATDPDGDVLTFSLLTSPSGMSIDSSTGVISWTPILSQVGVNNVTVNVSDGSLTETQSYNITVTKGPKLQISDLDVKVDGKTDKNLIDGDKISKEAKPGSKVIFSIEVENLFTDDEDLEIEDIEIIVTILDIDDGDDLDEDAKEFDLKAGKDEREKIEFEIPLEVEEDTFDVLIEVEGEDENGTTHEIEFNLELEVEKENHEIRIIRSALTPSTIKCQRTISINTEIINTGSEDEDDVTLEVMNSDLSINSLVTGIELDEGTDDNRFTKLFTESISTDVLPGTYPITINTYYDGKLSETDTVNLDVEECELVKKVKEEVKKEKPKVKIIKPKIILEKKPVPPAAIPFTETEGYNVLLAIFIVIFIGTAIFVIGAGFILLRK
ncbi:MAG: lamin tail domain-containing protein [Nanoarchaeota archaeon]|nr:lamin tail domain-containing protein [Nanoarchaeota archaeon]